MHWRGAQGAVSPLAALHSGPGTAVHFKCVRHSVWLCALAGGPGGQSAPLLHCTVDLAQRLTIIVHAAVPDICFRTPLRHVARVRQAEALSRAQHAAFPPGYGGQQVPAGPDIQSSRLHSPVHVVRRPHLTLPISLRWLLKSHSSDPPSLSEGILPSPRIALDRRQLLFSTLLCTLSRAAGRLAALPAGTYVSPAVLTAAACAFALCA